VSSAAAPASAAARPAAGATYLIAVVCGMAAFMEVLDTAIANVSLVHIAGSLSATPEEATWVLTSYLVANAIVLPMTGWLADTIGRKRYYLGCIAAFTLASLLCGLAPSLPVLVLLRIVQGLAGAGLQPISQSILTDSFAPEKRGTALAVYGMSVIAAPAVGPTLGGWLTEQFSWHWIFLINVPVGILLFSAAGALIHDSPQQREVQRQRHAGGLRIDYLGFALIALGMGTLQLILDLGQKNDWFESGFIVGCTLLCLASLVLLVWRELHHEQPIINLRLLGDRNFAISSLLMMGMSATMLGLSLLMPQMMQTLLGYSALDAGLVLSPAALLTVLLMPLVGKLTTRIDPRVLACFGFTVASSAMLLLAAISLDISSTQLMWLRILQMSGQVFTFIPINTISYANLQPGQTNSATAIINLMRNLGGSIGISLVTFSLARASQTHHAQLSSHVDPLNPVYQSTVQTLSEALGSLQAAQASIVGMISQQAAMLAFLDAFHLLAAMAASMAALVWLSRRVTTRVATPMDAH